MIERSEEDGRIACGSSPMLSDAQTLVLRYDESVGCWLDPYGNAMTITATADIVDAVRSAKPSNQCIFCKRRFGKRDSPRLHDRMMHMLNRHG